MSRYVDEADRYSDAAWERADAASARCPYCGDHVESGYVTCGASECQEASFRDNPKRRRAKR